MYAGQTTTWHKPSSKRSKHRPEIAAVTQQQPILAVRPPAHLTERVVRLQFVVHLHFMVADWDLSVHDAIAAVAHQDQTENLTIDRTRVDILQHLSQTICHFAIGFSMLQKTSGFCLTSLRFQSLLQVRTFRDCWCQIFNTTDAFMSPNH